MPNARRNLILSVEHSGTRFVKNHLLRGQPSSYHHLVPQYRAFLLELLGRYRHVFVPLRHPRAIAWSWARKGKPLNLLAARFDFLAELLGPRDPLYIPVDAPNRIDYIVSARCRTGYLLEPGDWPKVGHERANSDYRLTSADLAVIDPAIARNAEFFRRFYSEVDSGLEHQQRGAA